MRHFWRNLFRDSAEPEALIPVINNRRAEFAARSDAELKAIQWRAMNLTQVLALVAVVAERVLGLKMFDVQLRRRAGACLRKDRRDANRRRQNIGRRSRRCLVREGRRGRSRYDGERLPGAPRRPMDGRYLRIPGTFRGPRPARNGRRKSAVGPTLATLPTRRPTRSVSIFCAMAWRSGRANKCTGRSRAALIDEADSILIDEARIPLVIAGGDAGPDVPWPIRWTASLDSFAVAAISPWMNSPECRAHRRGHSRHRNIVRLRQSFRRRQSSAADRRSGFAARPRAAAPRRGLPGERRRHRIGG